ncbi:hypothetical protein, partial [Burkholderia sp. E168m23]|uniref:hypothetical protein n=1 Tax=Burkholderia sp. E168m23 TaxID=1561200 RepID=UPI001F3E1ABB
ETLTDMHDVFSCGPSEKESAPMIPAAGRRRAAPGQTAREHRAMRAAGPPKKKRRDIRRGAFVSIPG